MYRTLRSSFSSLPVQIVAMLVGLVLLTALTIGIPSLWLIHRQLDRQAWALAEQGSQALHTLIAAEKSDLNGLAVLTAQRPTLLRLLADGEQVELAAYLSTLRAGAGLDLLLLCDSDQQPLMLAGGVDDATPTAQVCQTALGAVGQAQVLRPAAASPEAGVRPAGWLLLGQPISGGGYVVVGRALGDAYLEGLRQRTGLEAVLLLDGAYLVGSLPGADAKWVETAAPVELSAEQMAEAEARGAFSLQGAPYYGIRARVEESNLEMLAALSVGDIMTAQRQFTWIIVTSILFVIMASTALGAWLARRISQPLVGLRNAAVALRQGDLATPVSAGTRVRELAQVAYALEDARSALQHSLGALRQEKEWTDTLLESVLEGIVTLDRHGRVTFFSRGAETMTGWKQEQVMGKPVDEVFHLPDATARFSDRIPAAGGKQTITVLLGNGRKAMLAISGARLAPPEAGRAGTALVLRDVSNEEAIRRLLGDFLSNITHEFRTPLSALAASIELLLDQLPTLSQEELKELLDSLYLGILGLQTLVDNLLEGASIEAGRFRVHPRPADLQEIIHNVARIMHPLFNKYHQSLALELPEDLPAVQADPRRTGQVLVNLLSNAIKAGPPGSRVTLTAVAGAEAVQLRVADQGPGITSEQRQDVFTRFANLRGDSDRAEHGAGLGLSVVKAIVEAQKGQVGVEDSPRGGAVFWFSVPLAAGPGEPEAQVVPDKEDEA